jgi:predicted metal-binding membrane protein
VRRLPLLLGLTAVLAASWAYLGWMAWGMHHMDVAGDALLMPRMSAWRGTDLLLVAFMWALMMTAMMLPSAMPLLLLLFHSNAGRFDARRVGIETAAFLAGYLAVWNGFGSMAALLQWGLLETHLISPMMESRSVWLDGALLLAAGIYQISPLKNACLTQCRSPIGYLLSGGGRGGMFLGLRSGLYCAGCCWLLMCLMFAFGVMNLFWMGMLTVVVLLEKLVPRPRLFSSLVGAGLLVWGAVTLGADEFVR